MSKVAARSPAGLCLLRVLVIDCTTGDGNLPLPGYDAAGSDAQALAIADRVMERLGGRQNWDNTRYLSWRFFGSRRHVWDKWSGDIRIESAEYLVLMNVHSQEGRAWPVDENGTALADREIKDTQTLAPILEGGYAQWTNDSYWLVMPYKLNDTGVTLTHTGQETTDDGQAADVVTLTFTKVGKTPQNKYDVFVNREDGLVSAWAFYSDAVDAEPRFQVPWGNWQQYGAIWLSDDRGDRDLSDLAVFDDLLGSVFSSPDPLNF